MSTDTSYLTPPPVLAVCTYIDVVRVWVRRPLKRAERRYLRKQFRPVYIKTKPMVYQPWWCQQIIFGQPSIAALRYLDAVTGGDHLINYVELASEYVTEDRRAADALHEYLNMHLYQPWHGKQRPW